MEKFVLTKEHMMNAVTYVDRATKESYVEENARKCFDKLVSTISDGSEMPPMYMENTTLKSRYLLYALVYLYLNLEGDFGSEDDPFLMNDKAYDYYMGSHIISQIHRMKKNPEVGDICYDLMEDYSMLCRMFDTQIRGLLAVQNDTVTRQQIATNEAMQQLPEVLRQLKEFQAAKGGGANGG